MNNQNNTEQQPEIQNEEKGILPKVGIELSKVASSPRQSIAIIIGCILAAIYLVYNNYSDDKEEKEKNNPQAEKVAPPKIVVKPSVDLEGSQGPVLPSLPKAPALQDPSAPPVPSSFARTENSANSVTQDTKITDTADSPGTNNSMRDSFQQASNRPVAPPLVSSAPTSPLIEAVSNQPSLVEPQVVAASLSRPAVGLIPKAAEDPATLKRREDKKKSSIMLISGTPPKSQEQIEQDAAFKPRTNLEYVLTRGKVIDAVIETAINTDFAGEIRAVISRDVFSESGKVILVPKGSRIFGSFSSTVDSLYGRISINWERIDLPTGYTLTFSGTGVDSLGRKGAVGRLDNKIKEKISNSILSTALNVAFAGALDKIIPPQQNSSQATQVQGQATSVQTAVQAAFNVPNQIDTVKIAAMCSAAKGAVTDTGSSMYQQIILACNVPPAGASPRTAQTVYDALMAAANTGLVNSATASTPTKAQEATEKGMEDFTKTITDIIEQSQPKPTVTIDQGTKIKVYVNKDYKFPRAALNKSRFIQ